MVEYSYDAWGNPISKTGTLAATLGTLNPFRYRGYVYDEETGLYYLQNRYYRPEWRRFINADKYLGGQTILFSHNQFAYCANRPLIIADPSGLWGGIVELFNTVRDFFNDIAQTLKYLPEAEKRVIKKYPFAAPQVFLAKKAAEHYTDVYWGKNATNADLTKANAFKHAFWNALMTRDHGLNIADAYASAHELVWYGNHEPYYGREFTTYHESCLMDLHNNTRGRIIGYMLPRNATDEMVAEAVLTDMREHPDCYYVIDNSSYTTPIK